MAAGYFDVATASINGTTRYQYCSALIVVSCQLLTFMSELAQIAANIPKNSVFYYLPCFHLFNRGDDFCQQAFAVYLLLASSCDFYITTR
jgi:hypothetical protein